jgi:hypothetical protein
MMKTPSDHSHDDFNDNLWSRLLEGSSLFRQSVYERYFRFALLLLISIFVSLSVSLPKFWRTTPPGFSPVIRVSLFSLLQAKSLRRNALKLEAEGKLDQAIVTWRQALANNLGDEENGRHLLAALAQLTSPTAEETGLGTAQAGWLMQLNPSNRVNVDLAARFFSRHHLDEYVVATLEPIRNELTDEQAGDLIKSLFHLGKVEELGMLFRKYPGVVQIDDSIPLFQAAWQAAWGPPATLWEGRRKLAAAQSKPSTRIVANQLQLAVSLETSDLRSYSEALNLLKDYHADRPLDHVRLWRLLMALGQRSKAKELAKSYSTPPTTYYEARLMSETFVGLDLKEYAVEFLEQNLQKFGYSPDLWRLQADLLQRLERWEDIRMLAVEMRARQSSTLNLSAYAWYIEGLASLKLNKLDDSKKAFNQITLWPETDPVVGYRMADGLAKLGYPKLAGQILAGLERVAGGTADYWFHLTSTALEIRDFNIAANAAARAYALQPDHPAVIQNYAATLLTLRTNPTVAVQLTLRCLTANPDNISAKLNHVLALIQNDRLTEAEALLNEIPIAALDGIQNSTRHLAMFELYSRRNRANEALGEYSSIEPRFLYEPQLLWLDASARKLGAKPRQNYK